MPECTVSSQSINPHRNQPDIGLRLKRSPQYESEFGREIKLNALQH
jgi:hypothetical protein